MCWLALLVGNCLRIRLNFKVDVASSLQAIADIIRAVKGR